MRKQNTFILSVLLLALLALVPAFAADQADPEITDPNLLDPKRPLERELEMNVTDGFTLGAVGDCIISRPLSQYAERDEEFAKVVNLLRQSDAMYGNLETTIIDIRQFKGYPHSWEGDWTLSAEPQVAKDLALMGFDLFSRANNHAFDWGVEGMRETGEWLDDAGLVHAGAGESEGLARRAQYFESKKGRVAIVSMVSSFHPESAALPPHGAAPGRPGVSALGVRKITVVPGNVMAQLRKIRCSLQPKECEKSDTLGGSLQLFSNTFETGKQFGYRYEMDPSDLAAILKSIRLGKQHSDFLIATIHSHETLNDEIPELPAGFLQELARAAIDAGADAFLTTGHHHLGPIEIYKKRPIFYGLGNFFWSDIVEPLPSDLYQGNREMLAKVFRHPDRATDADLNAALNAQSFSNEVTFQTMIAVSRFEHGGLSEIRLYPVDLGYGRVLTESGTPRMASPEKATEILKRVESLSTSYGTTLQIENHVGVIRP